MDPRVALRLPEDDRRKNNTVIAGLGVDSWRERAISEVRGLRDERGPTQLEIYTRQSRDPRVKPEDDKKESPRG